MLSLKLNVENTWLWKFLFPNAFFFKIFFILPDGCSGLMSRFLASMCQFCLHMPVPKVPSRGQVVCAGAREQELQPHGAQCPLQASLAPAAPGHGPHSSFLLPAGSQAFLMPLRWGWQAQARPFWWGVYAGPVCDFCQTVVHHFCSKTISWLSVCDDNLGGKVGIWLGLPDSHLLGILCACPI